MTLYRRLSIAGLLGALLAFPASSQAAPAPKPSPVPKRVVELKREAAADVERMAEFTQQTIDMLFSFGELAFHEVETSWDRTSTPSRRPRRSRESPTAIPWSRARPATAKGTTRGRR